MVYKLLETIWLLHQMKAYQKVDDFKGEAKLDHLYKFYPEGPSAAMGQNIMVFSEEERKTNLLWYWMAAD